VIKAISFIRFQRNK